MFLGRKIKRSKWDQRDGLDDGEIPSHAVTVDLKTSPKNDLSFWKCGVADPQDVLDVALALAASADRVDSVEVVWLPMDELSSVGVELKETRGRTPVSHLEDRHVDAFRLDYNRLGHVAESIVNALRAERHRRLTKKDVRKLLARAVRDGSLSPSDLDSGVRAEIAKVADL